MAVIVAKIPALANMPGDATIPAERRLMKNNAVPNGHRDADYTVCFVDTAAGAHFIGKIDKVLFLGIQVMIRMDVFIEFTATKNKADQAVKDFGGTELREIQKRFIPMLSTSESRVFESNEGRIIKLSRSQEDYARLVRLIQSIGAVAH